MSSGGRIIAFSSSVIAKAFPTYGPYIASKAGVEGLVHVLANELRGHNITVHAVAPGPVATELFLKGKNEAQIEHLSKVPPKESHDRKMDDRKIFKAYYLPHCRQFLMITNPHVSVLHFSVIAFE